jgi:integrase
VNLTDMTIRTAPLPAQGRVTIWDDASPLGLRITAKGAKTFILILHRRRHTIGRYGDITLSQARAAAKQLKAEQTLGRLIPSSKTVSEAAREYLKGLTIRTNTRRYYQRHMNSLPDCRLTELTAAELHKILDLLPSTSRGQALKSYTAFFNWCIRRHYLDTSPCVRFRADKTVSRSRVLTDEELGRIWRACDLDGTENIGPDEIVNDIDPQRPRPPAIFCQIVKLLILTGQRKNEIANLQSSWIKDEQITIPKEIAKNGRQHTVPIGPIAKNIILRAQLPFTSRGTKTFNNWAYNKLILDTLSGVTGWTLHDCRRSVATNMGALGIRLEVIERILNHVSGSFGGVAGTYQRYEFLPEMIDAMHKWEARLRTIISGSYTQT